MTTTWTRSGYVERTVWQESCTFGQEPPPACTNYTGKGMRYKYTDLALLPPPPLPAVSPHWLNSSASHKAKGLTEWSLAVSLPGHNTGDRDLGRSKAKMRAVQAFWVNKGANHPLQLITHHFLAHSPHTSHLRLFSTKLTKAISHPKPVHMLFLPPRILLLLTCSANYL